MPHTVYIVYLYSRSNKNRHAELNCVDEALELNENYNFQNIVVYVNVEPCIMCISALSDLKVAAIFFGCKNDRFGGCGSVLDITELFRNCQIQIRGGLDFLRLR